MYALNPENGHAYWKFGGSTGTFSGEGTPALSPDGTTVYLTTAGGDLYALSAGPTGGQLAWTYHIQGPQGGGIANAPAVGPDGTIYVRDRRERMGIRLAISKPSIPTGLSSGPTCPTVRSRRPLQ